MILTIYLIGSLVSILFSLWYEQARAEGDPPLTPLQLVVAALVSWMFPIYILIWEGLDVLVRLIREED